MEAVAGSANLNQAYGGAAGVDGMTVEDLRPSIGLNREKLICLAARWQLPGVCHVVGFDRNESTVSDSLGSNAHGGAPCLEGLGAEPTLRRGRDEMPTDVESVVDRGM
jgi:hypothetical protein